MNIIGVLGLVLLASYGAGTLAMAAAWYPVPLPQDTSAWLPKVLLPAARDVNSPGGLPVRKLFDYWLRDPNILRAPDGYYYMVATAAANTLPEPLKSDPQANAWHYNDGIPLWRSKDLIHWETMGYVWTLAKDATWAREFKHSPHTKREDGAKLRAVWAPEIHYLKGTYWIPYSMNYDGIGILKSTTGKPEGPYVDVKSDGPFPGDIDASLFEDSDGTVYYLYGGYRIARMKPDMSGLAEEPRQLRFEPAPPWGEGINMIKVHGHYVWINSSNPEARRNGQTVRTYDCFSATSDSIYGPYTNRYRAIPFAGHNNLFQDDKGNWWSTLFHDQPFLQWPMVPGLVALDVDAQGRISPKRPYPRPIWKYVTEAPGGHWLAEEFNEAGWKPGEAGFGDPLIKEAGSLTDVGTAWKSDEIWLRKVFRLSENRQSAQLYMRYSGMVEIWINGRQVYRSQDAPEDYITVPIREMPFKAGANVIAVHCRTVSGLRYVDVGLVDGQ